MTDQPIDAPINTNDGYRPPSIADGTVAPYLVDTLLELIDAYGAAGVQQTLQEINNSRATEQVLQMLSAVVEG